jgi:biofilm PGA synthesis protein PgaA
MRTPSIYTLLLVAVLCTGPGHADVLSDTVRHPDHDRAVALARDGAFEESLRLLGELRSRAPDDLTLLYDETAVLAWAGEDARAATNARSIERKSAPDYVLDAAAKAFRNTGDYAQAVDWYGSLLVRDDHNLEARLGLFLSHVDSGAAGQARHALAETPEDQLNDARVPLAEAYLLRKEGREFDALARYQRALDLDSGNREALRGQALVLRELLMPGQALALAAEYPGILSDTEIAQLQLDVAAVEIRQGSQAVYPVARRYEGTDRALAHLDMLLARPDIEPSIRQRLEYDRVVALTDRHRTAEAIAIFEALDQPLSDTPVYVLSSAAIAYLDEHRPLRARELLEHATRREPDNTEIRFQLFFAYADLREYDKARALSDELLARIPKTQRIPDSPVVKGSPAYLRAAILAGLARAYADQLGDSQQYFEALLAELPNNTDVRHELANVYRWRGWLDRSLAQYAQVLAVEPDLLSARIGEAHARLDSRDYDHVAREVAALEEQYGDEPAVQNLARRWRLHNRSELSVDVRFGESSGATFGEDQYEIDGSWYSQPIRNRYRVLVRTHDAFAEFPEGDAHRRRAGLGLEYRYGRWRADAGLAASRDGGEVGLRAYADYRFSDVLKFGASLETESDATPLRGYRAGVSSNLASVSARYARHEATGFGATLSMQDFSDGNAGRTLLLDGAQRVFNAPRYKLALVGNIYIADRDRDDVAYFSPRTSFSWETGLRADWSVYRDYRLDVSQSLTVQAGRHDQAGYDAGGIWSADYRLSVGWQQRWYTDIGARRQRGFYDGTPEHATYFVAGFSGRF